MTIPWSSGRRSIGMICGILLAVGCSRESRVLRGEKSAAEAVGSSTNVTSVTDDTSTGITRLNPELVFEANRGQHDREVLYAARTASGTFYATADATTLVVPQPKVKGSESRNAALRTRFVGASTGTVTGEGTTKGVSNYYGGGDRSAWVESAPHVKRVRYSGIYPGIDALYYGHENTVEYDLLVSPGADASRIQLAFEGASEIHLDGEDLAIRVGDRDVRLKAPVSYQMIGGERRRVETHFLADSREKRVRIAVGDYDRNHELVIDPVITWASFIGGFGGDGTNVRIAIDGSRNVYAASFTKSTDYPKTNGANGTVAALAGGLNAGGQFTLVVSKLSADGSTLLYSTYLTNTAAAPMTFDNLALAVASDGTIYTGYGCGSVACPGSPTSTGAFRTSGSAYVAKINPDGVLGFGTYMNPAGQTQHVDIALSPTTTDPYVFLYHQQGAGEPDTATKIGAYNGLNTGDVSITRLAADGKSAVRSTHFGGTKRNFLGTGDNTHILGTDPSGNVYVGFNTLGGLPGTTGKFTPTYVGGGSDVYIASLNENLSAINWATYLGGTLADTIFNMDVDASGNVYVIGDTTSTNFPVLNALQSTYAGTKVGYIARINNGGANLSFSTYFNEPANIQTRAIRSGPGGKVWIVGGPIAFSGGPAVAAGCTGGTQGRALVLNGATGAVADYFQSIATGSSNVVQVTIDVDSDSNLYVAAQDTIGAPVTPSYQNVAKNPLEVWIAKYSPVANTGACLPCTTTNVCASTVTRPYCTQTGTYRGVCAECSVSNNVAPAAGGLACSAAKPICAAGPAGAANGGSVCYVCDGAYQSGTARACPTSTRPICTVAGTCDPCDGDFGAATTAPCSTSAAPHCSVTADANLGKCFECTDDTHCLAGKKCSVASRRCVDKDTDGDGISDAEELVLGTDLTKKDSDEDGITDDRETSAVGNIGPFIKVDSDNDGTIDALDIDSDNDSVTDKDEGYADTDADGSADFRDDDDDNDGIVTKTEVDDALAAAAHLAVGVDKNDVDGDGKSNWRDLDSDGDGKADQDEGRTDNDSDGVPNYLDVDVVALADGGTEDGSVVVADASADAATKPGDASIGPDATVVTNPETTPEDPGCSCRAAGARASGFGWLGALVATSLVVIRRRRRRA